MKRLFGLIGFTFLFVLSAVFYSDFNEIVFAIIGSLGLLSVAVGIFLIISKKNKSFGKSLCVFAFAVIYSAGNMIAYSEYINNTVINNYSDKEITASGYICDEIITTDSSCSFVIKTDKINGQPSDAKIQIISYSNVRSSVVKLSIIIIGGFHTGISHFRQVLQKSNISGVTFAVLIVYLIQYISDRIELNSYFFFSFLLSLCRHCLWNHEKSSQRT